LRPALLGRLGRFNVMITCHLQATDTTHSTQATLRYDTIEEINVDSKAEYTA